MKYTIGKLKLRIKKAIPPALLNNLLLCFSFLYRIKLINYETNICEHGIKTLLYQLEKSIKIEGNIIECGSSRCGTSIIFANYLQSKGISKLIYACDSFGGFDLKELEKERQLGWTKTSGKAYTSSSYDYVNKKLKKLKLNNIVIPIKGFFKDTLSHINSDFCFALIDCDLKESTFFCSEMVWKRLKSRGCILIDDYDNKDFQGAKIGADFFVNKYKDTILTHQQLNRFYCIIKK